MKEVEEHHALSLDVRSFDRPASVEICGAAGRYWIDSQDTVKPI